MPGGQGVGLLGLKGSRSMPSAYRVLGGSRGRPTGSNGVKGVLGPRGPKKHTYHTGSPAPHAKKDESRKSR